LLCLWIYSSSGQLDTMWSIVSSYLLHILHIRLVPSFIIRAWYDLLVKLWSCATIIRPSVSAFSPVLLSHFLVLFWSKSASLVPFGYLPWSAFSSHSFDNLSWSLCFVFYSLCIYSGLFIFKFFHILFSLFFHGGIKIIYCKIFVSALPI